MLKQKIAYVDLSTGEIETRKIPEGIRRKFLGGRGIDMYLLYNHIKPGCDPLGPDNVFVASAGVLSGTLAPSCSRFHVGAKSPLTGLIGSANSGGYWAPELRFAGFDHIVVKGKADSPVYLFVHDSEVEIRDASHIWGTDTIECQQIIRDDLNDQQVKSICIGQAGENLVRFASVRTGQKNAAGRTGIGAVMGSKNLKAIAVRGTLGVEIAHPEEAFELYEQKLRQVLRSKATRAIQEYGTMVTFNTANTSGQIRVKNFQDNTLEDAEQLEPEYFYENYTIGMAGCFGCPIHCRHKYVVPEGPTAGQYTEGPEYTTLGSFGTELNCNRIETVLRGNHLANLYGFDTLEFGSMVAWAIELHEKGLIDEKLTRGLDLEWGNEDAIFELVEQVTFRKGLGDILAEGPERAIRKLGEETRYYNINVKGMSNLHSDERAIPSFALGIATATRGSDHLRSRPVTDLFNLPKDVLKKHYGFNVKNDYSAYETKGKVIWWHETYNPITDSVGICRIATITFSLNRLGFKEYADMIRVMTGMEFTPDELQVIGERIYTTERLFNIREGATRKDDYLNDRYFEEPTPSGLSKNKGKTIDREKFEKMLEENYAMHGWDKEGVPMKQSLEKLGLDKEPSHLL